MRVIRAASAALLGAAALALTAPVATAAPEGNITPFGFSVTPSTIAAGGKVTLSVTDCDESATASSAVFDNVTIPKGRTATATVDFDAKRGAVYKVTFTCDGSSGTTNLTIAGSSPSPRPTSTVSPATIAPTAGVRGGLGGSVAGVSTAQIVAGTALVMAAATGTIYVARRRAEGRGH